jgi:hypothetical protein
MSPSRLFFLTIAAGPLLLLDPNRGVDGPAPLTNLTPEVGMPEYKVFPLTYYQALWMDTYIPFTGHFSDQQETEIAALRERWKDLLDLANGIPQGEGGRR